MPPPRMGTALPSTRRRDSTSANGAVRTIGDSPSAGSATDPENPSTRSALSKPLLTFGKVRPPKVTSVHKNPEPLTWPPRSSVVEGSQGKHVGNGPRLFSPVSTAPVSE